ncbi:uncharacterized protein LOC117646291 [Thrips palmi]|uniref:Uncharacterized protein LOC117646291 n=1 Tax=Thrips palmi TaxID=161013 RepID=A0A6P8YZE8_THRPL|nr:uncharacterized protein LOC117646291 [Thrips palmi]XP_034243048.1 uncharacterized protein LOC117646291 [Thrips palmi]XP_034243056.1 uncharacterized protein LOC117646291 [Thrips palmi]XP_034243064.1 uncharacterized protein LOC117646291 [Thrips palmi]
MATPLSALARRNDSICSFDTQGVSFDSISTCSSDSTSSAATSGAGAQLRDRGATGREIYGNISARHCDHVFIGPTHIKFVVSSDTASSALAAGQRNEPILSAVLNALANAPDTSGRSGSVAPNQEPSPKTNVPCSVQKQIKWKKYAWWIAGVTTIGICTALVTLAISPSDSPVTGTTTLPTTQVAGSSESPVTVTAISPGTDGSGQNADPTRIPTPPGPWPGRTCNETYSWQCKSGDCTYGNNRCDGAPDCEDNSDEADETCYGVPTVVMSVGHTVSFRLHYQAVYSGVMFLLCNEDTVCSKIEAFGSAPDGALYYIAWENCDQHGLRCRKHHTGYAIESSTFSSGVIEAVVERRDTKLQLWLSCHQDKVAYVRARNDTRWLRVRPIAWYTDMRVDFSVPSSLPTATASPECATLTTIQGPGFGCRRDNQWQCRDGRCIDARWRCDLNRDCNDASDEDSDTCTSVPTLIMNVGDTVLARMKHKENYHGVRFLMAPTTPAAA